MANPIKYSTGSESLALKKGNFYIGTGDVGKGPTSTTGYYNGITPPSGGYTIYLNKATGGPSIYTCSNDTELVSLTNSIAGTSYTTANECLVYFAGQSDKLVFNRDYEGIVTDGLVLNLDAGFTPSYPKNGTTVYNISGDINGTLLNGPSYNSTNGGNIVFDGSNDYLELTSRDTSLEFQPNQPYSCMVFFKSPSNPSNGALIANMQGSSPYYGWDIWFNNNTTSNTIAMHLISNWSSNAIKVEIGYNYSTYSNQWVCIGYTYDGSCPTTEANTLNSINFYLNGNLHTTNKSISSNGNGFNSSSESIPYNTSQRFRLASRWSSSGWVQGSPNSIGVVQVYNRELSSDEMSQNFNAQKDRFGL